jgi:UDP-N-acetylmuramate dehydrogenase
MDLLLETDVPLAAMNTFGVAARAARLVRVHSQLDVRQLVDHPEFGIAPKLILGGGSNLLLTGDPRQLVVKVEIQGLRVVRDDSDATIIEAGAGVSWHELVRWSLAQGHAGLENLALIPGTVGAAPVQNIGAYGLELAERFHALDAVDLTTGRVVTLDATACRFGYRDSLFKHELAGKSVITQVRLRLPKPWVPRIGYVDLERHFAKLGVAAPDAQQIFDAVCAIRRSKLPDPAVLGNAGSFFKNPVVNRTIRNEILEDFPEIVSYPLEDGSYKLAAAWMIEACGWKGRELGRAAVDARHALVLVNRGGASGKEIKALAEAVQQAVRQKFGITLEFEPLVV